MYKNNIIISTNTKLSIEIFVPNNRIIIKESFAKEACLLDSIYLYIYFGQHFLFSAIMRVSRIGS